MIKIVYNPNDGYNCPDGQVSTYVNSIVDNKPSYPLKVSQISIINYIENLVKENKISKDFFCIIK